MMLVVLEGIIMCFVLLIICVVGMQIILLKNKNRKIMI